MPDPHFSGNDTFTYRTHSSLGPDSNTATVTIHVSAPPTAQEDSYTTAQEDQPFNSPVSVLANDQDQSDGETLSAVLVGRVPAAAGSVSVWPGGSCPCVPAPDFDTTRPLGPPITFT